MIVYVQSEMEFHREEKDEGEIFYLDQFHMILVWFHFSLSWAYIVLNMWYIIFIIIHHFLKIWLQNQIKESHAVKENHRLWNCKTMTFFEKIMIMYYNNGLYDLHYYVKNDLHTRMK